MAIFDSERKRVVIRVVYDGPGFAGKTTNLRRLCKSFASWRRSEMVSPNTLGERTQYFDWLEVDGGLLRGYPIRAQLLTVPGQRELTLRRMFVLERADAVVFVADSQPESVDEARSFYAELCEQLAAAAVPVPLIFQANKQDLPGALSPARLVRLVCADLRKPDHVRAAVASTDKGVKQTLSQALRLASKQLRGDWERVDDDRDAIGDARSTLAALEQLDDAKAKGLERPPRPTLPTASLPSENLWPPASARELLARIARAELSRVSDPAKLDELVLVGSGWRVATRAALYFEDEATARAAMTQLTRRKTALGSWLPEPSALALQPDAGGRGAWLWHIAPSLDSLEQALTSRDPDLRRAAIARYAEACVGAAALAEREQLRVDLEPEHFAIQEGDRATTRYIGDALGSGDDPQAVSAAVFAIVARFGEDEGALADFVETLCIGLRHAPLGEEARAALREAFAAPAVAGKQAARIGEAARSILARPAVQVD
ncbi:hypothetical protein G6O69_28665 [Pseudenhygromyxa sp. WMMC2535]|uniref:ADP-ribosylation factor-like protein n=1 Tax=Pseudenhygromyxa sp. WMMC2535 TaxID=2712867 RepID=UPI001557FF66|nr:ADP-ribosylation factor-like protein [Pseudenhygromyxa sp. WMMC2535]NVB41839.1 hypothetical protein [Pseudenhygromyxa sp. WMMC2535]